MNVVAIGNLRAPEERLGRKPRIMVAGEFSAGKTRLINGLIGTDILPSNVTATALPPVWIFGAAKCLFRVDLQGQRHEIDSLADAKIEDTAFCAMSNPSPFLDNFDVIDTPGNSDPNIPPESWERMLQLADAIIWCTNATQAWRQSEKSAWSTIPSHLKENSLLLITHSDRLPDDASAEKVMRRVRRHLDNEFTSIVMASLVDDEHLASLRQHVEALFLEVGDLSGAAQPEVERALLQGKFSGLAEKLVEVSRSLAKKPADDTSFAASVPPSLSIVEPDQTDAALTAEEAEPVDAGVSDTPTSEKSIDLSVADGSDDDLTQATDEAPAVEDADEAEETAVAFDDTGADETVVGQDLTKAAEPADEPYAEANDTAAEADEPGIEGTGEDVELSEDLADDADELLADTEEPATETDEPDADKDEVAAEAVEDVAEIAQPVPDADTPDVEAIEQADDIEDAAEPDEATDEAETLEANAAETGDEADVQGADVGEPTADVATIPDDETRAIATAMASPPEPSLARDTWNMVSFGADMSDPDELLACIEAAISEIDRCLAVQASAREFGLNAVASEADSDDPKAINSADEGQKVRGEG